MNKKYLRGYTTAVQHLIKNNIIISEQLATTIISHPAPKFDWGKGHLYGLLWEHVKHAFYGMIYYYPLSIYPEYWKIPIEDLISQPVEKRLIRQPPPDQKIELFLSYILGFNKILDKSISELIISPLGPLGRSAAKKWVDELQSAHYFSTILVRNLSAMEQLLATCILDEETLFIPDDFSDDISVDMKINIEPSLPLEEGEFL